MPKKLATRLVLFIDKTSYVIQPLEADRRVAATAWRLFKIDPESVKQGKDAAIYDVHLGEHGAECTCESFTYNRSNSLTGCKHIEALRAEGLLPELIQPVAATKGEDDDSIPF